MKTCCLLSFLFLLTSCGEKLWWTEVSKTRSPASVTASAAYSHEAYFLQQTEEKLRSLHGYYGVGRKYLKRFDQELSSNPASVFRSESYQKLLAVKSKTHEIESDLLKSREQLKGQGQADRLKLLDEKINEFANVSAMSYLATKPLRERLQLKTDLKLKIDPDVLEKEQKAMMLTRDFVTHQLTIDHLAHALSFKSKDKEEKAAIDTLDWMPQLPEELRLRTKLLGKKGQWETLTERPHNCKLNGMTSLSSEETLCPQS